MNALPRLYQSRHGVYYFRITQNKRKVRWSLNTKDFSRAKIAALALNLKIAMTDDPFDLDKLRRLDMELTPNGIKFTNIEDKDLGLVDSLLAKLGVTPEQFSRFNDHQVQNLLATGNPNVAGVPTEQPKPKVAQQKSLILSEVIELYLNEAKIDNVPKTIYDKNRVYDEFISFFSDRDINEYSANDAVAYKNRLLAKGTGVSVINSKMSYLKMLFLYAINNNLYFAENPFEKVKVSTKAKLKKITRSYKEFSDDDLKAIFEEVGYTDYLNKPDYYWLPLMGLYTGARLEELASLNVDQVYEEDGQAKNANSVRKVPLHKKLLESKFLDYLKSMKEKKETLLFPHLKECKNGYSKNASRRFGLYMDKVGIKDDRKVFHSFRHTFINRLTNMGVHPALLMSIVGHYEQSKVDFSSPHFANYQHEKPMKVLKEVIDRLEFPVKDFH